MTEDILRSPGGQSERQAPQQAPLGLIALMWAIVVTAVATTGYFFAGYMAVSSELSVVERQIHSLELLRSE